MKHLNAIVAGAIAALPIAAIAGADTVDIGLFRQIAPRPMISYTGAYASAISSSLVTNPQERTLVSIDLYAIMQSAGMGWIESIQILDGEGNAYNGSPGADIDFVAFEGLDAGAAITYAYTGSNAVHLGEASSALGSRISLMDAVSGDQDWNCQHFVSLGASGQLAMTFAVPMPGGGGGGGGGSGGSGGSGPGEFGGGGGGNPGGGGTGNLIQVVPGLRLLVNEAGLGESYFIRAIALPAVPAPAALPILAAAAGLVGRRRRR